MMTHQQFYAFCKDGQTGLSLSPISPDDAGGLINRLRFVRLGDLEKFVFQII
jgi:hypothetical protein